MTGLHQRHGAFPKADGTTEFALWGPDATSVGLRLANEENIHPLTKTGNGWFNISLPCPAGTHYNFVINNELHVPDPATRSQIGDVHGVSCVVDHQAYSWKNQHWKGRPWHEAVIYELHVGLFGGFAKVEQALPNLVDLGITAIELMPINEFPGNRNWGYDGVLLFAPESAYGTPDELKSLIDTAHNLGLAVILDVVYNHFGPDGNYIGQYAKEFFREDIHTPWGAAIDFRKPEVRNFFFDNALMWIVDYRFDGLRLDAVHAISEKDFLVELADKVRAAVPTSREVYLILENEDNAAGLLEQGFDAQWNDDGHNVLHHLLTDEKEGYYADFAESPTAKLARFLSEGFIYQGEKSPRGRVRGESSGHLPPTAFVLFLQNHDQIGNRAFGERLPHLTSPEALKTAVTLLLLSPMIPLLFMGEEWGSKQPFLFFTDHHDELAKAVCEGRRKEFSAFSGFESESVREKIPDPNAPSTFTNSTLHASTHDSYEHHEWWNFYQRLLTLRRMELVPRLPGTRSKGVNILADKALCASWQLGDGSLLRIYINLSDNAVKAAPDWSNKRVLFTHQMQPVDHRQRILPAFSALVTLEEGA